VQLDANLADIHIDQLNYDLNKSTYEIALHVNNHTHQYDPLERLHVKGFIHTPFESLSVDLNKTEALTQALLHDAPRLQARKYKASLRPTALHVSLGPDGNISHYEGELLVKTDHEILTCKPLLLSPTRSKVASDFRLESDDLKAGTPILPDFLEGATAFYGTVDFDKDLALHVKNDAIHFSKALHRKIDANATYGFDVTMRSDVSYGDDKTVIDAWASSPFFNLNSFTTHIDLNRSALLSDLQVSNDSIRKF